MKPALPLLFVCLAGVLGAQQKQQDAASYTYDLNGRRIEASRSSAVTTGGGRTVTEKVRSVNGREVPLESVEERVVTEAGGLKVVERVVRKYDQDGRPGPPEKIRIEEQTGPGGAVTSRTTIYRADLNGNLRVAERMIEETRREGQRITATMVVEKPAPGGSMEVAEKKSYSETTTGTGGQSEAVTYRRDPNGGFYAAAREKTERTKADGAVKETSSVYEAAEAGSMQLTRQTVSQIRRSADGSELRETDIYTAAVPGRATTAQAGPQLLERQIHERKPGPGDTVVDTLSVSRPTIADPGRLGSPQKVSEVVCKGECGRK